MAKSKKKLSPLAKRLDKTPSRELYAALGRRSHKHLKEQAPEVLVERAAKRIATVAIRAKYCAHTKLQPKVRAKGPNISLLCCPSCNTPLEQWASWMTARCCDPNHKDCKYEGLCWILREPGKAKRYMPCPECGGFEFDPMSDEESGRILNWMRLEAETALDSVPEIKEDIGGKWPHIDRAIEKIENILYALSKENSVRFPQPPFSKQEV